jgi:virginiamycin B lyase
MSVKETRKGRFIALALTACMLAVGLLVAVASPASAATVTNSYRIPTSTSNPIKIVQGPDGNMWFTEVGTGNVARITPGGAISEFNVAAPSDQVIGVAAGPDGYIWFTVMVTGRIGKISPDGSDVRYWDLPPGSYPIGIVAGPDGAMWFTESLANKVSRVTTSGTFTRYDVPSPGSQPSGICVGPDGALWFAEANASKIGRVTTSGAFHEYTIPTPGSLPSNIVAGSDGALWFNEMNTNKIGKLTTGGVFHEVTVPTGGSQPDNLTSGPDGAIWFTEYFGNKIGRVSMAGGVLEFPEAHNGPRGITAGPDGALWFLTIDGYVNRMDIGTPTWYLAEGSTAWGFDTYISIQNPNASIVHAAITYMTGSGPVDGGVIPLAPASQVTLFPRETLAARDFSTRVECVEAKSIAVDRTMIWTGTHSTQPEAHSSIGVTSPALTWFLPEGSSAWNFECWLLIQNPTGQTAHCNVTYMIEGEAPRSFPKTVGANQRQSFNMADDIGAKDASIRVTSDVPVIPERSMYRYDRREGHDSIGTTTPSPDYYLAEGTTAWGFTTFVLVQNPNANPADVTVTYMTSDGPVVRPAFTMEPNSRRTIRVNDVLPNKDFSTKVSGTMPIIAERAMYYTSDGEVCHDSIGLPEAHKTFYLPDGNSFPGFETWTLVQNPNTTPVTIAITYMTPSGTGNQTRYDTIGAGSRKTYLMGDTLPNSRASIQVVCTSAGKKIMSERAMYWNHRNTATDTIGGFSDL